MGFSFVRGCDLGPVVAHYIKLDNYHIKIVYISAFVIEQAGLKIFIPFRYSIICLFMYVPIKSLISSYFSFHLIGSWVRSQTVLRESS